MTGDASSTRVVQTGRPWSRGAQIAIRVACVAALSAGGAITVWFVGFDWLWAFATVLAVVSVGVVFATVKFEEDAPWHPPGRETPRGIRLSIPMMEESLAACDRLARPAITRPIRVLLTNEREDRLARGTIVRQMRAILVAELRAHGVDPSRQTDEAVVALLGPDAIAVLQPNDDTPVTSAVITSCLDAVALLATETSSSS